MSAPEIKDVMDLEKFHEDIYDMTFTKDMFDVQELLREKVDDHVNAIFIAWGKAHGIHLGYGMEKWSNHGSTFRIKYDTSCRGCYNTESLDIPSHLFFLPTHEALREIIHLSGAAERAKIAKAEADRLRKIASLEDQLKSLKGERA